MMEFSNALAWKKIQAVVDQVGVRSFRHPPATHGGIKTWFIKDKNGLRLSAHKNTWKRKRESGYIIRVEYFIKGQLLMVHIEPWISYPSDVLIAKLMLLPREVNDG